MNQIKQNKLTLTGLKRWFTALILVSVLGFNAMAQVSTTVTMSAAPIAGSPFGSLAAAISAVNGLTITGPVVVTAAAGTETAPAGTGYYITATGTVSNTIVIQGTATTTITAGANTAGGNMDAIFKIVGGDYISIQNFTMQENTVSNTVTATGATNTMTEAGVLIIHASATDGAQNNTVQNNIITLSSSYPNAVGILSTSASTTTNASPGANTSTDATSTAGTNSNNKIYGNTISGVAFGIIFVCPPVTATVFETGNDIGGTSALTGNTITYGINTASTAPWNRTSSASSGMQLRNAAGNSVRFNTVSTIATLTLASTAINVSSGSAPTGVTFTSTISDNTIVMTNTGTTAITAIDFGHGISTGTIVGSSNNITINQNSSAANSAAIIGIKANYASATNTCNSNTIVVNQSNSVAATTSAVTLINAAGAGTTVNVQNSPNLTIKQSVSGTGSFGSGAITFIGVNAASGTVNVIGNNLNTTGSTIRSTGTLICIDQNSTTTVLDNFKSNVVNIDRVAASGTVAFTLQTTSPSNVADTVSNNSITFTGLTGTTIANGISQLGGPTGGGTKSICGNTINITGTNTGATKGIAWGYSVTGGCNVRENSITLNTASATMVGIEGTSTSAATLASRSISNNIISLTSSSTSPTSMIGINVGATGPHNIVNNTFSAMNFTGVITGAPVISGIACATGTGNNINNNVITNISVGAAGSTASPVIDGVLVSGGVTTNVFKNKIYGLTTQASGATTTINGVRISGGGTTANSVYNNYIGDLTSSASTNSDGIRGISITSTGTTTTNNIYYNTVLISGSGGSNFGGSGIFHTASATATTSALNLRNNVIVNNLTPNGTGLAVAFRRSTGTTGTLANFASTSNNNLFYAGTPGASNLIYSDGTSSAQSMAAYKSGAFTAGTVAPRDAASVTENPNFVSTTGSNVNFLHINTAIPTQIESSGSAIAGIADDYDGDTRNATTPDIGADEFTGILADITGPAISYTVLGNTACLGNVTLSAVITDASLVNSAPGTKPRLYFKKSTDANTYVGNSNTDNGWKFVEATNSVSPYSFTTDYSLLQAGLSAGDVIQYFVVAQDLAGTPNVGINNGSFAATPSSVSLTALAFPIGGVVNSYSIINSVPTSITIGAAGTYTSLTGAGGLFDAINNSALSANTVATIIDATVSELGTIALNQMNYGCTPNATLTIKPATTSVLTGATATGAIIKLNGADYVTIDGSNSGGTDRSLTIQNTTTTTSGNAVVWLAAPASGNGSTNNVIKNCIIEGNASTTSFTGLHIGGGSSVGLTAAGSERNNNNTIQNNLFRKTQYGVTMFGFAAVSPDLNNVITQNNFGTATVGEGFSLLAINADRQQNLIVSYNEVQNVRNATNTSSTPYGGIRLLDFKDGQCFNNNIHDLAYSGTSTPKIYGIAVTSSTYTTVGNPSNALIYNNTVSRINSTGTSSVWNLTGILASAGYGDRYYNNSVHLTGQLSNTASGLAAAFANGDGNVTSVCTNIDVRNNIFNLEGTTTGGNVWAYYSAATTLTGSTLNYNNLRCAGTGATNNIGRFNAVNYTTLLAWQTATGQEANSISVTPTFLSNTDLHLNLGSNSALDNLGTPLAAVTIDIDGTTRSITTPDMGADEFSTLSCSGAVGGTASGSASFCNSGTPTITATGYSVGTGSTYQWVSSTNAGDYPLSGTPVGGQTNPASLTTGVVNTTTYYWLVVTCTSGLATDYSTMVTITVNPSAASVSGATSKCANDPAVTLTENGGTGTSWLWSTSETTQSISVNPSSTTTYTVTVTSPGSCTATATKTITVSPNPTGVTASASASSICNGSAINLTSTSNPGSVTTVFSENFNSTTAGTTTSGNLPGGWSGASLTSGVRIWGVVASAQTGSTIGGGNFLYCESDVYTAFQTRAEVVTPVINLAGYTSVNIKFKHYYNDLTAGTATDSARVYVSNDGGTNYTLVQAYDSDQGTAFSGAGAVNATLPVGIALTNNMKIKLVYNSDAGGNDWYWAVDDFIVEGIPSNTYAWTSTPSGFTSAVQNPTGVTPTVSTDYTVTVTGVAGCTATASTGVVTVNDYPVADAPANVTACDSYTLPALTVGNYFSGSGGTGTAYSAGNNISSSMTMYVYAETGTTPNCTDENSFTITINNTPVADAPANVTACDSYTLPALSVGNYFSGPGGTGTAYSAGNVITSSMTMYVYAETGTTPNCTDENSFTITINTSPTATISGDASICAGGSTNLTLNFTGTGPWTYAINGGSAVTTSNNPETVSVSPASTTVYTITSLSDANCSGTGTGSATVTVSPAAPDFLITFQPGPVSACVGNTVNLTLNPVNNAQTYTWSAPAGTLINGQVSPVTTTSNSVTLTLGAVPANGSGWNICVFASNPCGNSQTKCAFIRGALSTPAAITGDKTACPNTSATYSTSAVAGANSYLWTGTNGITFTGSGTTVTANFPAGFTTGTICVAGQLSCGYTGPTRCITVTNNVGTLGVMSGAFAVCPGQTGLVFSVPPVAGVATYNWTTPTGVTVTSGAGTNSVTVTVGGTFTVGNICVTATSICGVVSAPRCKTISSIKPATPGNISGSATGVCNTTVTYSVPAVAGVTSYNWTLPSGATFATANGTNTVDVTFSNSFTTGQLCVSAVNGCGASTARCINVKGAPAIPGTITAPGVICANEQGTVFSVNSVFGATTYTWAIPATATLIAGQGTNSIVVDWGANGGLVTVTASNGCGNSGTRTYLVTLTCRSASTELPGVIVAAYPNPVSSTLTVSMDTPSEGNFSMMMTDLTGRVMFEQQIKAVSGMNETAVDVSTLAKGIYMLTVKNETGFAKQIRVTVQ